MICVSGSRDLITTDTVAWLTILRAVVWIVWVEWSGRYVIGVERTGEVRGLLSLCVSTSQQRCVDAGLRSNPGEGSGRRDN